MTCLTKTTKIFLCISMLLIGCQAPMQEYGAPVEEHSDTSYIILDTAAIIPAQTEVVHTVVATPTVTPEVNSDIQWNQMPELEIQQTSNEYANKKFDTLPLKLKTKPDSIFEVTHKKNCSKVKVIDDTIRSIDEKFKKIEERIKQYKK